MCIIKLQKTPFEHMIFIVIAESTEILVKQAINFVVYVFQQSPYSRTKTT